MSVCVCGLEPLLLRHLPDSLRIEWATKSACLSVLRTPVVRKVGVMSVGGSLTWHPNIYTTLGKRREKQEWITGCRGFHDAVLCFYERLDLYFLGVTEHVMLSEQFFTLPVDGMAHARNESGQEQEWLPVWRFFTRDTTHITVRPAITLK